MTLYGKDEEKNYIVFDPYIEEAIAVCVSKDIGQILEMQPKVQFVECTSYELFKYKEKKQLPADIASRKRLSAKDIK